jgi:precorrin-8X/cobalt-precorrin-8 methylmutase
MSYEKNPETIELGSFEIITKELKEKNIVINEAYGPVIKRVIHTTADFEYGELFKCHPDAIASGIRAIKNGAKIYTDTNMIKAGLNSERLGCSIINYVHDDDVKTQAKKESITRSMAAIEKAVDENIKIFAIGNAPTALFKIIELIKKDIIHPDLIIGVPVGFVGAAESKEELMTLDVPWISIKGRKGGSPVAVSIINGLYKMSLRK